MTKKKNKGEQGAVREDVPNTSSSAPSPSIPPEQPSTSALIICRNKHWRYISSFHGPWLQLPPEVLESLAYSNYFAPRPHPVDPAVFFDLVKIRKAVDEATNLAVRAASGVTTSSLHSSMSALNGMAQTVGQALGLGVGGNGGAKLSRERQHRMRELATQKLSYAYHLDEIAASVATMQSASTLEDLAQLVLRRNARDYDARYVHFFHEKIPSRMMAQCTPLDPLDHIVTEKPNDASPFRTRALTKIFKEDYFGAAKDLTEGLAIARWQLSQHRQGKNQVMLAKEMREEAQQRYGRDWKQEIKIPEEDHPSSLEAQLLFHRAGVHLTIAFQHVHAALDAKQEEEWLGLQADKASDSGLENSDQRPLKKDAQRRHLEYRKVVKLNAKKALRDYNAFLSHFDYTPGLPPEVVNNFIQQMNSLTNSDVSKASRLVQGQVTELPDDNFGPEGVCDALIPAKPAQSNEALPKQVWPSLPPPPIYKVSELFSPSLPAGIPVYPPDISTALALRSGQIPGQMASSPAASAALADAHEAITYHPLVTDALHSLLLCHSILQTPPTELRRHAHNAARLARICDGYPIFLAARSPARADWVEVLRRAHNWIGLTQSWDTLCRPAPLPGQGTQGLGDRGWHVDRNGDGSLKRNGESEKEKGERRKQEAILEALADDRVVDEETFQRAVRAREKRAMEDEKAASEAAAHGEPGGSTASIPSQQPTSTATRNGTSAANAPKAKKPELPKRAARDDSKDYPISTDRAEAIARWICEAPIVVEGSKKKRAKPKKTTTTGRDSLVLGNTKGKDQDGAD